MSIESTILTWVGDVTGLDAWQAPIGTEQDKPTGDYATFQLLAVNMSDFNQLDAASKDADFISKTVKNNATILISFNIFGDYGYNKLTALNASGDFWQHRNTLQSGSIAISKLGNPQNLTGLGDTNFVERWQCDMEFSHTIETIDDWHKLKSMQLAGKFLKTDGSGIINALVKWPLV